VPAFAGEAWVEASRRNGFRPMPWLPLVGRLDDRPVAVALAFFGPTCAGLYGMGTLPEARGRGVGGALTLAAMQAARDRGHDLMILHSTEAGFGMYRRVGFRQVCTVDRFLWLPDPTLLG
jgi:ribosomal protein S18 acetylase RimI-like enzyme